jgi:hypothetical protein
VIQANQRFLSGPGEKRSRITSRRFAMAVTLSVRHDPMACPGKLPAHNDRSRRRADFLYTRARYFRAPNTQLTVFL